MYTNLTEIKEPQDAADLLIKEWGRDEGETLHREDLDQLNTLIKSYVSSLTSMLTEATVERDSLGETLKSVEQERDEARSSAFLMISAYKQRLKKSGC